MPEVLGRKLFENFQIRRSKDKDLNINNVPRAFLTAASFSPPEAIRNKSKWNQDLAACLEVVRWRLGISAHTAAAVKSPSQGTETCAKLQKGLQSRDLCLDPLLHLVQHQSRCCSLSNFTPTSIRKKTSTPQSLSICIQLQSTENLHLVKDFYIQMQDIHKCWQYYTNTWNIPKLQSRAG